MLVYHAFWQHGDFSQHATMKKGNAMELSLEPEQSEANGIRQRTTMNTTLS
jgi:hypothetical protein